MKIGLVSDISVNHTIKKNTDTIENIAKKYSKKINLICFGEAFLHGFDALSRNYHLDKDIALDRKEQFIKLTSINDESWCFYTLIKMQCTYYVGISI